MIIKNFRVTAICTMAVIFIGLNLTGCVTSRHIDELKAEHREMQAQIDQTTAAVKNMETLITEGAEASNKLRADVSLSTDEMKEQMYNLLNNYNELLAILQQMQSNRGDKKIIIGSVPGDTVVQQPNSGNTNTIPPVEQPVEPAIDCGAAYDDAFILVRREDYAQAIESFENYLTECPNHSSAENAHYWIGECFYAQEKYVDAVAKFEYLLKNYKSTVNASRAMYKLGRCQQELGKKADAKTMFEKLIDDYPETLEASQAKERLKDL
ncbi:MAG: tol-pal system protein YbgF [Calditrichaeota bacterium]|nr:MAG: tol-pal system protein YbgF [Calditrichota bacterium]